MRDVLSNETSCAVTRVIKNVMYCAMFWGGCERSQLPKIYSITQVLVQLSPHCGALCKVEYIFMHITFGFRSSKSQIPPHSCGYGFEPAWNALSLDFVNVWNHPNDSIPFSANFMKLASETEAAANSVDDRFDLVNVHNSKWQQ